MSQTDSASPINTIIIKIILHTYLKKKHFNEVSHSRGISIATVGASVKHVIFNDKNSL